VSIFGFLPRKRRSSKPGTAGRRLRDQRVRHPPMRPSPANAKHFYLTESVDEVALQKSIPVPIHQVVLYISSNLRLSYSLFSSLELSDTPV